MLFILHYFRLNISVGLQGLCKGDRVWTQGLAIILLQGFLVANNFLVQCLITVFFK